jgi:hypothetical protein
MPFQAGDDDVLKSMRRGYTYDSYMKIIRKIRSKAPDAAICADIIVVSKPLLFVFATAINTCVSLCCHALSFD